MNIRLSAGAGLCAAAALIAGCRTPAPLSYAEPGSALAPMPPPSWSAGDTWVARPVGGSAPAPGGEYRITVAGVDGDTLTWRDNLGCEWTAPASGPGTTPRLAWSPGCPDFTFGGRKNVRSVQGQLWPLEVGNRIVYRYTGYTNAYGVYTGEHVCEVTGTVRVTISDGRSWDTYKVYCVDQEETWTWYVAPETGAPVVYRYWLRNPQYRYPNTLDARYQYEYVRSEPAA